MTLVKDAMKRTPVVVYADDDVRKICRLLTRRRVSGAAVVDKRSRLVGFISERDIIAAVPKARFVDFVARDLMKRKVATLSPDAPLAKAMRLFTEGSYRMLPVVEGGKVVGTVLRKDVIRQMMVSYY